MNKYSEFVDLQLENGTHIKGFWVMGATCAHCKAPMTFNQRAFAAGPPYHVLLHSGCAHLYNYQPYNLERPLIGYHD